MNNDEARKAEAWWRLKARFAAHGPAAGLPLPSYCAPEPWKGLVGIGLGVVTTGLDRSAGSTHDAGAKRRAFE